MPSRKVRTQGEDRLVVFAGQGIADLAGAGVEDDEGRASLAGHVDEPVRVPVAVVGPHHRKNNQKCQSDQAPVSHPEIVHRGPKPCPDEAYGRKFGVSKKFIRARGGAEKLRTMSADAEKIMMEPHEYDFKRIRSKRSLKALGMPLGKWKVTPTQFGHEAFVESVIQAILRERGLIKDA